MTRFRERSTSVSDAMFWLLFAMSLAWVIFMIVVMVAVLKMAREGYEYFRRANEAYRRDTREAEGPVWFGR